MGRKCDFGVVGEKKGKKMGQLIINGNQVYEIDEECMKKKKRAEPERRQRTADEEAVQKGGRKTARR